MAKSKTVDDYIATQPEWQQVNLRQFRDIVHEANPEFEEDIKWGVPVFILAGKTIFAMSTFKAHTKYNFILNGAYIKNQVLFNNGLESKKSRGIDLQELAKLDLSRLKSAVKESINLIT